MAYTFYYKNGKYTNYTKMIHTIYGTEYVHMYQKVVCKLFYVGDFLLKDECPAFRLTSSGW